MDPTGSFAGFADYVAFAIFAGFADRVDGTARPRYQAPQSRARTPPGPDHVYGAILPCLARPPRPATGTLHLMRTRPFAQVDVFGAEPYLGNPLAVILDATDLTDADLLRIARWTNLSETTFVLPPTLVGKAQGADYRVRILTPAGELPFAGHPTLGTAHAWVEDGWTPRVPGRIVQECGAGLVTVHQHRDDEDASTLAFEAPPTTRSGPVSEDDLDTFCASLHIHRDMVVDHQWVTNGPGWAALMLPTADDVLALRPDFSAYPGLDLGVLGPYPAGSECAYEVRAFLSSEQPPVEDPVTGSLNASIGQWLLRTGQVAGPYTASQGTAIGRAGRVRVTPMTVPTTDRGNVLVGGTVMTLVRGSIRA